MKEFIEEFGSSILHQDNAITAHPIYVVEQRRRIYGMDPAYGGDNWEWCHEEGWAASEETIAKLNALAMDGEPIPVEWEKVYYIDVWERVYSFFLLTNAEEFIERNKHNLNEPRIYVDSAHRNPEWKFIRGLILKAVEISND